MTLDKISAVVGVGRNPSVKQQVLTAARMRSWDPRIGDLASRVSRDRRCALALTAAPVEVLRNATCTSGYVGPGTDVPAFRCPGPHSDGVRQALRLATVNGPSRC
jgi:hypothetical protein